MGSEFENNINCMMKGELITRTERKQKENREISNMNWNLLPTKQVTKRNLKKPRSSV
jgi:hypothetical protein